MNDKKRKETTNKNTLFLIYIHSNGGDRGVPHFEEIVGANQAIDLYLKKDIYEGSCDKHEESSNYAYNIQAFQFSTENDMDKAIEIYEQVYSGNTDIGISEDDGFKLVTYEDYEKEYKNKK